MSFFEVFIWVPATLIALGLLLSAIIIIIERRK